MAEIVRESRTHVTIGMRLPRARYEQLRDLYLSEGQALRAVRLMFEDAVSVAIVDAVGGRNRADERSDPRDAAASSHTPIEDSP